MLSLSYIEETVIIFFSNSNGSELIIFANTILRSILFLHADITVQCMQTLIHYLYTIMHVWLLNQINEKHKISTADDFLKDMQVSVYHACNFSITGHFHPELDDMQVNTIVPLIDKCPARELVKIEARTKRPLIRQERMERPPHGAGCSIIQLYVYKTCSCRVLYNVFHCK